MCSPVLLVHIICLDIEVTLGCRIQIILLQEVLEVDLTASACAILILAKHKMLREALIESYIEMIMWCRLDSQADN